MCVCKASHATVTVVSMATHLNEYDLPSINFKEVISIMDCYPLKNLFFNMALFRKKLTMRVCACARVRVCACLCIRLL